MSSATRSCCPCTCRSPRKPRSSSVAATGSCSSRSARTGGHSCCPRACGGARSPAPAWQATGSKWSSEKEPEMGTADEREAFERLLDEVTARAVPLGRTAGEVLFAALTAGGPEAADHLLKAARELLL